MSFCSAGSTVGVVVLVVVVGTLFGKGSVLGKRVVVEETYGATEEPCGAVEGSAVGMITTMGLKDGVTVGCEDDG